MMNLKMTHSKKVKPENDISEKEPSGKEQL